MNPEVITIIAVGVAFARLILNSQRSLRNNLDRRTDQLEQRIDQLDGQLRATQP